MSLEVKDYGTNLHEIMDEFEKQYILLMTASKTIFLHQFTDDEGKLVLMYKTKSVINDEWAHRKVTYVGTKKEVDKETRELTEVVVTFYAPVAKIALEGVDTDLETRKPMKRWQDITFLPGKDTSIRYNLFKGFDAEAKKGDISLFMNTMRKAFNKKELSIALDWFADMYQNPDKKILWSIIAKGEKGTGKNTLEEMLGRGLLRTENYFRTSDKEAIFGRFTGHLASNLLMVGQEIVWGGEHQYDSTIKELITETTRKLERKGIDATTVPNYSRLFMTSNADWVVPASGKAERRYFVIETNTGMITLEEWAKLYEWYENGGREALMYEMTHRDVSNLSRVKAPYTKALESQLEESLYGIERFVYNLIDDGFVMDVRNENKIFINEGKGWKATDLYTSFLSKYTKAGVKYSQTKFGRELFKLLDVKKCKSSNIYYKPKSREACAEKFYEITNVKIKIKKGRKWR